MLLVTRPGARGKKALLSRIAPIAASLVIYVVPQRLLASAGTAALLTLLSAPLHGGARVFESIEPSASAYKLVVLASLGGSGGGLAGANGVNDSGSIAGTSYLAGNKIARASLWTLKPSRVIDLGTLGGPDSGVEHFTDDKGLIVGASDDEDARPARRALLPVP